MTRTGNNALYNNLNPYFDVFIDSGFIDLVHIKFISEFSWYITLERASCAVIYNKRKPGALNFPLCAGYGRKKA